MYKDVQSTKTSTKCWAVGGRRALRLRSFDFLSPAPAPRPRAAVELRNHDIRLSIRSVVTNKPCHGSIRPCGALGVLVQ
eukprot:1463475-Prymnesium_polylepis.1